MIKKSVAILIVLVSLSVVVYLNSPMLMMLAIVWSSIAALFHYLTLKRNKLSFYRSIFFTVLAICFLLNMHLFSGGGVPYCHIGMAGNALHVAYNQFLSIFGGSWHRYGALSIGILWLLIIFTTGQGFCSYTCFFGGVDDGLSQILKKPLLKLPPKSYFREFQVALLIFLLLLSYAHVEPIFCRYLCPFKLTYYVVAPLAIIVGVLFLILLPIITKKRTFCSAICPFGAIPPLVDKLIPYKINIDTAKCDNCRHCIEICPSFAICEKEEVLKINRYCTLCGRCVDACPNKAIELTLFKEKPSTLFISLSYLLAGALSLFIVPRAIYYVLQWLGG